MNLNAMQPSLGGHLPVVVGRKVYGVPRGSRVAHVRKGDKILAYVLNAGRVHCLVESGEVTMAPRLQALVKTKVFGLQ